MNRSEHQILRHLWQEYFETEEVYEDGDPRLDLIAKLRDFLLSTGGRDGNGQKLLVTTGAALETDVSVRFDYQTFLRYHPFPDDFARILHESPAVVLACLGLALCLVRFEIHPYVSVVAPPITARFLNHRPFTSFSDLKSILVGKFVTVVGNVVRASSVTPLATTAEFECVKCGAVMSRRFPEGKYNPPSSCVGSNCKARTFELLRETAVTIDFQKIKLQEVDGKDGEAGRMPRSLEVEVTCDLVDRCIPGDVITVTGVVCSTNAELATGKTSNSARASGVFLLYLKANNLSNAKSGAGGGKCARVFSEDELRMVREIAAEPAPFELLVASLCPGIYGHEVVKAGLILALLGGTRVEGGDVPTRSDPHMLIVGDPGLGKSQMLQAVAAVAPRSVYVCGNTASASGLTVTVTKDGGDVGLEAGALVLADQGVCCIDEFDKMTDPTALLEAMEQQSISIAKGGVVASLSARCSVVAAANPVGGHYARGKTVAENLKMGAALLSRFDLLFVLVDRPDESHDRRLSEHIMRLHAEAARGIKSTSAAQMNSQRGEDNGPEVDDEGYATLSQRLRTGTVRCAGDPLPHSLLSTYVDYARRFCSPKLTVAAARVLQTMYLVMRSEAKSERSTPITTRQLDSLIRLSQARAKADLRQEVTEQDAKDVVDMMQESLLEVHMDDNGGMDFGNGKRGMSLPKQIKQFVAFLHREADRKNSALFTEKELIEIAGRLKPPPLDFHGFLDVLRNECYILKRGSQVYQVQTSVYSQRS